MFSTTIKALLGTGIFIFSTLANAAVIDFEDLGIAPGTQLDPSDNTVITSGGFNFVNGPQSQNNLDLHFGNDNGITIGNTTELISHGDLISMESGGASFSLLSFDFGSSFTENFSSLSVIGYYVGGGSITQNFSIDGITGTFDTIFLNGAFNNLESVNWLAGGGNQGLFNIDNISVSAVPVPAAVWLFGSALAGLGWLKRRQIT